MTKKQDMEDLDRFTTFIKNNPDVRDMILNALDKAMNKETNNAYVFNPMTDGNTERTTLAQRQAMSNLIMRRINNDN
jgi:hypothetical protein